MGLHWSAFLVRPHRTLPNTHERAPIVRRGRVHEIEWGTGRYDNARTGRRDSRHHFKFLLIKR